MDNIPNDTPVWATNMIQLFKGFVSEIRKLNENVSKLANIESRLAIQKTVTDNLFDENNKLYDKITKLEKQLDDHEQHGRNVNLLLHGVKEVKNENSSEVFVTNLTAHLPVGLTTNDIARCHRLGPPRKIGSKPRPLIARFSSEMKKIEIFRNKKHLKGQGIVLSENLTKRRWLLLQAAVEAVGIRNVWSQEGRVYAKHLNHIIEIKSGDDVPPKTNDRDPES